MRTLMILTLAAAALSCNVGSAKAGPGFGPNGGPWCAYYDPWSYNCGFATFQQCLATISGAGGVCQPNPYGGTVRQELPRRHKRARARY